MFISILLFIIFLSICVGFGFVLLSQITKIKSLLLLVPLAISFGISAFFLVTHIFAYLIGPQTASIISLLILFIITIIILTLNYKNLTNFEYEISKSQFITICSFAFIISIISFIAISRYGVFDKEFHVPFGLTIYHNNVYPPRDIFRPDYIILYHFGGDLIAGAINHLCKIDIFTSYELLSVLMSGTTFLSLFALAWLLTKNYKLSLLAGFVTYFGGGLLWFDAIIRHLSKNLPPFASDWNILETFFNIGIHGSILNAPSISVFVTTFSLGYPILILSLILFWKLINEENIKVIFSYVIFLVISLFTIFMCAEWLYVTFWAGVIPFTIFLLFKKRKKQLLSITLLLFILIILNKTIGNPLFLQESTQGLGRRQIFDIGIKENLFNITSWGRLTETLMHYQSVSAFSWDFIAEFGFSLILFPIVIIYLIRSRNQFAILLFLCAALTMPVPLIFDFKINPVDLNRLFSFGNGMIMLLITCSIGTLYKTFFEKKILLATYIIVFCLSPLAEILSSTVFTPRIFLSKQYTAAILNTLAASKSINDVISFLKEMNQMAFLDKVKLVISFKDELDYLRKNSKPLDVAISNLHEVPAYAGVYSLIPGGKFLYKDLLFSPYENTFLTIFETLDPYILDELNIKWILISKDFKEKLPEGVKYNLSNKEIFKLAYRSKKDTEIYCLNEIKDLQVDYLRKTAWLLVDERGQPVIELASSNENKIRLFPSSRNALSYLKDLYKLNPNLKKKLITAQTILINSLEEQITKNKLNIALEKRF